MNPTKTEKKVTINKLWLYRTQPVRKTQQLLQWYYKYWECTVNLSEMTQKRFGCTKFLESDIKGCQTDLLSLFLCFKNTSAFRKYPQPHKHSLLYALFPVYMRERSLCGWKMNFIYMHMPIRPMNKDSRQLACQSQTAESKWKWELRRKFTLSFDKNKERKRYN